MAAFAAIVASSLWITLIHRVLRMAQRGQKRRRSGRKRLVDPVSAPGQTVNSKISYSDPIGELNIWSSADMLLNRFGGVAVLIASKRADVLLDKGDLQGASVWGRIAMAIAHLERRRLGNGGMLH